MTPDAFFLSNNDHSVNVFCQVCHVHMVLKEFDQETTQLTPDEMIMNSKTELTQYYIKQWQLTYIDIGKMNHFPPTLIYN